MVIIHQHSIMLPHIPPFPQWKVEFIVVWLEHMHLIICTCSENILESYLLFQKEGA